MFPTLSIEIRKILFQHKETTSIFKERLKILQIIPHNSSKHDLCVYDLSEFEMPKLPKFQEEIVFVIWYGQLPIARGTTTNRNGCTSS